MSMHPSPIEPVPEETVRVARAAFRKGNLLMRIRDEIGILYDDQMFASLYDARGQLAISPWRLALALHAPVLLCFGLYCGGNRYDLHFEPFADLATAPPPRAARAQWLQQQVHAYAARLEHHARRMPFNWFNFYDFWSGHER